MFPGRPDMIAFLKRAVVIFAHRSSRARKSSSFLYGLGRNGKGTFLRVLSAVLGDYACKHRVLDTDCRSRPPGKGPRNDIASIAGEAVL